MRRASFSRAISATPGRNSGGGITLPAVPLHRLDDHGRDHAGRVRLELLADEVEAGHAAIGIGELERAAVAVGVRHEVRAGRQRAPLLLPLVADQAHDPAGLAVEAAPEAHHLELLRVATWRDGSPPRPPRPRRCRAGCASGRPGASSAISLSTPSRGSVVKLPTVSRCSCCVRLATKRGWEWPRLATATPAKKSRYSLPSTSTRRQPRPSAIATLASCEMR